MMLKHITTRAVWTPLFMTFVMLCLLSCSRKNDTTSATKELSFQRHLQVYDFDLDGDEDVLTGVNKGRATDLGTQNHEIIIFLSGDGYKTWKPFNITKTGIYNGQVLDFDQDGDLDIFQYPSHNAEEFYLLKNLWIN